MENRKFILLRRIFGILLSISILTAGICLIAGCLSIYNSGDKPYSREAVAATFAKISVPVFICLGLTVISLIVELVFPLDSKVKNPPPVHMTHKRLYDLKDTDNCDGATSLIIKKERNRRKINVLICIILVAIACIATVPCALDMLYFHPEDINKSVATTFTSLAIYMIIPFGYAVFSAYRNEKSMRREIDILKQLPAAERTEPAAERDVWVVILRTLLLALGALLLIYGFVSGGTADVLTKAINICTECIGLG